ncbi:MAG: ankyrin repeat domain-containing protein [Oscillochloris sp.]|nr:ankyrin repeat domain-containing protein [Oscillochloris sp.]
MDTPEWDGIIQPDALTDQANAQRQQLADAAKNYDWNAVLTLLTSAPNLINTTRPGGQSRYTVLHQAAHGGAPAEVIEQLIALGAWRTLRTAQGERAVDIAQQKGYAQLMPLLTPALKRSIAPETLQAIQGHFHAVIQGRRPRASSPSNCACLSWSHCLSWSDRRCGSPCRVCTGASATS